MKQKTLKSIAISLALLLCMGFAWGEEQGSSSSDPQSSSPQSNFAAHPDESDTADQKEPLSEQPPLSESGETETGEAQAKSEYGWQTIDGKRYYFDENGVMLTDWQMIDGRRYRFGADGVQMTGFQLYIDTYWYYYDENGALLPPGWNDLEKPEGTTRRYVTDGGSFVFGRQNIDGKWYIFGSSGILQYGWQEADGERVYAGADGALVTGWQTIDGKRYYFDENGVMLTDWQMIDGRRYRFDEDGVQMTGFQLYIDTYWYYYDENGALLPPGWNDVEKPEGTTRRYVTDGGSFVFGRQSIDGKWYIFGSSGILQYGWQEADGERVYAGADGALVTGWQTIDGKRYYFDENGVMLTDWQMIDGRMYCFNSEGEQQLDYQKNGSDWYYYGTDGELLPVGWNDLEKPEGMTRRYVREDGAFLAGKQTIDGKVYIFGSSGILQYGWQEADGERVYAGADGALVTGWQTIDGKRYYFDENGVMLTDWQMIDGRRYRFDEDGVQMTGFQLYGGKYWYYYDENGALLPPGWNDVEKPEGTTRRYVTDGGSFVFGRQNIDGKWYCFGSSGILQYGWVSMDDKTGYAGEDGVLLTGTQTVDGKTCYFTEDGYYIAPPTINSVLYTVSGKTATVKVTATASASSSLNSSAYSWDGGKTWTSSASKAFTVGTTIAAGTIQVRDAVGQITVYGSDLELKATSEAPYMGIDVSAYQGVIDWKAVKESGVDFAIIRALTWSNSVGYYVIDPYFEYNVRSAKENGIDVGAYLFSYAFSVAEIKEEVDFFHNSAEMKSLRADGIKFDYPVYIDYEWNTILEHTTYSQRTEIIRTGMILLEKYGYYPGFYSSHNWATTQYDAKSLSDQGYDFWYARYLANPDISAGTGSLLGFEAEMWQYASDGRVNGISGDVDMNICYVDYSSIIEGSGSGGGSAELTLSVYDVNSGRQVTGSVTDILSQIVMNEVGAWSNAEVCKAQAVAAYSWILYQQQHGNAIPSVGLATPTTAVKNAVKSAAGQVLYYDGSAANAAYGSASAATTNTAKNMWGLSLPYLNTPVESPETAYRGKSTTVKLSTMKENVVKLVGASLADSTPHDKWLTDAVFDENGYLVSIKVCGKTVSGGKFYENCWGLLSPNFTMTYNASADTWTFVTNGNGHCVGMSQYGAYWYATNKGWTYKQILAHYYPGTTLK